MVGLVLTLIGGYFFVQAAGYAVHWALHKPQTKLVHKAHNTHHKKLYPPSNYLSDKYRDVPLKDRPIWYYTPPAIALLTIAFFVLPLAYAIILTAQLAIIAFANDWLHTQIHIKGHWLEKYQWFWQLRNLHWHHHVDESKNLGIFSWFSDKILGTYELPLEIPSYYISESQSLKLPIQSVEEVSVPETGQPPQEPTHF